MNIILLTAIFAALLALVLGILLGIFRKVFHVETDVLVGLIRETLPGANCGACGFPGCDGFAAAVAASEAAPDKCTVSDAESTKKTRRSCRRQRGYKSGNCCRRLSGNKRIRAAQGGIHRTTDLPRREDRIRRHEALRMGLHGFRRLRPGM